MSANEHPGATSSPSLLRMKELAEAAGVPAATIKHYLREGLLPEPVRTSRNMAYYPTEFVERIRLIKQLQEERFLPLKVIRDLLEQENGEGDPERLRALVELEDRILERASEARAESGSMTRRQVIERYDLPAEVLDRLEELELLTPAKGHYAADDVQILEAISRMRAGGYTEQLGFTVYDALVYKEPLEQLVRREVSTLLERLVGEMPTEDALALIENAEQPIRDLIVAMRSKLLTAEIERHRAARGR